ncbi:MAG: TonB-dependent receptor [Bacteroidota bacterium]
MRRFVVLVILFFISVSCLLAQKPFTLLDTVQIEEVVSYGELRKYQSGVKIESISTEHIDLVQEGGLENVIKRFTPIYIKTDAGGLATIRFRGTSPNHTAINFGGININSLTLGHSNLSNIPSFLFDEISLQYGSSSAVNGSGAVGGALYLGLKNYWTEGLKISTKATVGSFGEYFTGAKIFTGNGRWESVSRAYFYQKENNFPFNNPYTGDVENPGAVCDVQKGAAIKNMGLLQELNYKFNANQFFKSSFWIENNWRQVQPNMQTNYHYSGTQEIDNDNVRIWSEYINNQHKINFKGGLGFVHEKQVFDDIEEQIIQTDRLVSEIEASTDFDFGLGLKAGAKYKYIVPNVHAYADSVIDFEEHFDIYLSSFYKVNEKLKFTLNLRQSFVTNFDAPFTPSLGAEYTLRTGDLSFVKITSALSRSYRVPTFNDRYWGIQGNPNLKPETGNNLELGARYSFDNGEWQTNLNVNAFYMDVKNWIEWRNFGVWMAHNVQEVVSKGVEFQYSAGFPVGNLEGDLILNYTFNPVEPVETIDNSGVLNRQMNYVPKYMGNTSFRIKHKSWHFYTDGQYTGKRFTDDFGKELPGNFIANSGVGYKLPWKKHLFNLLFAVNNVFDVDYQNQRYYAMPGRSFRFSIKYEVNINK